MTSNDNPLRLQDSVEARTGGLFKAESSLIAESLDASFALFRTAAASKGLDGRDRHNLLLFHRNCIYLAGAYRLARSGLLDPAGNNMRTVFETIVWQYGYLADAALFEDHAAISALEEKKFATIRAGDWSNTKERELENLRRKHSLQKTMKCLYSKEQFERIFFGQYWALCQKSHASVFGINLNTPTLDNRTTLETGSGELRRNLQAVIYLLSENITCLLNCFSERIGPQGVKSALLAANRLNSAIPPTHGLVPDLHRFEFTVRFRESV